MIRYPDSFLKHCLVFLVVIVIFIVLHINLIGIPLNRDEGGFAYLGQLISHGGKLYVDGCDLKPPGIFFVYSFLSFLVPFTPEGLHWGLTIYNLGTLAFLVCIAAIICGWLCALWTALIYSVISSSPSVYGFSGSAEMYMLLPITLGFLCAILATDRKNPAFPLLSGVLVCIAFWIKPSAIVFLIFFFFYILVEPDRNLANAHSGSLRQVISKIRFTKRLLWFVLGASAVSVAVCVYFVWMNTWQEFVYWSFQHPYEYSAEVFRLDFILERMREQSISLISSWPGLWAISLFYVAFPEKEKHCLKPVLVSFWLFSLIAAVHSPRIGSQYLALLCPATALLGASGICVFLRLMKEKALILRILVGVVVVSFVVAYPVLRDADYYFYASGESIVQRIFTGNPFAESGVAANYIQKKTLPDQKVLIIGSEPQILVLANRASATRYIYFYPLTGLYARSRELQAQFFQDVSYNRPEYVLTVRSLMSLTTSPQYYLDFMRQITEILKAEFRLEAVVIGGPVEPRVAELEGDASSQPLIDSASILIYRRKAD